MEKQQGSRRSFLKHILGGATVAAGAVASVGPSKAGAVKQDAEKNYDLYRETSSFSKYYKSLRS